MNARSRAVLVSVAVLLLERGEARAGAPPYTVALEYVAGPDCPTAAQFGAVVAGRLGYDPFAAGAADHVLVRIGPRGRAIEARVEWRDPAGHWAGEQTFPPVITDCPRFARGVAFALAVQIQLLAAGPPAAAPTGGPPAIAAPPPEKPPAAPAAPPPVPAVTPVPPAPVPVVIVIPPAPRRARGPALAAGAGSGVGFGMSSSPVLLARVFGVLSWPRLSIELGAQASLPSTTRRADGAGFSQQEWLLAAAGCGRRSAWRACLLAQAGQVRMAGEQIDRPSSATAAVVQAGARLGFAQPVGRHVLLDARADGLVNLSRWTARLDLVPVWTAPRFAAALGVDAAVTFP
jgi:hypothetical protein